MNMTTIFQPDEHAHKRYNALTDEWVLVSPHRNKRPWRGKTETKHDITLQAFDVACYLCPGNARADGALNPAYTKPYAFTNDFSALLPDTPVGENNDGELFLASSQQGICRVICFSPRHDQSIPQLSIDEIKNIIELWQNEYSTLAAHPWIRYIQIFENKGELMGCSNPHPHGQIWAQSDCPVEVEKETMQQKKYYEKHGRSLLADYLQQELIKQERVVLVNEHFAVLVPFWAVWPYETILISKRHIQSILEFTPAEKNAFADILKKITTCYDNLFETSFPYSAGMHQAPVNDGPHPEWHFHMHFYPPLLRSATIKKFMVGYEMLANPQRDLTPELAARQLKNIV